MPVIDEAEGDPLDLSSFDGDATLLIAPWPLAASGQTAWHDIAGIR
jgi:hypothetical protein